jgi:hypothetical protein
MEHEAITRLRKIAATPHNPRNIGEWPMPVQPSDLLILFERYDELRKLYAAKLSPAEKKADFASESFMRVNVWR